MKIRIYISLIFVFAIGSLSAQKSDPNNQVIEDLVEEIAAGAQYSLDYTEVVEDLSYLAEHPLNINEASTEDLESLWVLNPFQVKSMLYYRKRNGDLKSIYELALIDGFDYATIQRMLPFIKVESPAQKQRINPKNIIQYGNHSVFLRIGSLLETPVGYQENYNEEQKYIGSRAAIYTRYQFNYKKQVQFGFTTEKDAGEPFKMDKNNKGFDFYSMHLQIKDMGFVKNVVVGDYSAQFGQGVVIWSSMRSAKSVYAMNIIKHGAGLKKYSSTNENLFMRGAGVTIGVDAIDFSVFASHKPIDANLKIDSTLSDSPIFSSLTQDGIHANNNEMHTKDAVKESVIGGHLQWKGSFFKLGVSGLAYRFDHSLTKPDEPRNYYSFAGGENYNLGSNAELRFKGIHLFGELGMSQNKSTGLLVGTLLKMTDRVNVSVLYRDYKKDYHALYAGAFAENSYVQNEKGFYLGTEIAPVKQWRLRAYYDFYQFPWLKTGVSSPSEGNETMLQAEFIASRNINMYWRYRSKTKQGDADLEQDDAYIPPLEHLKNEQIRYQINYRLSEKWEFRNRIELSRYTQEDQTPENGFLIYQDIICKPFRIPLSFYFRYALFETDSYHARLYAYESDLLYVYSVLPYYNSGTRTYLMLKYELGDRIDMWVKYGRFWYDDLSEIGSGANTIEGNTKSSIKFQVRIKI